MHLMDFSARAAVTALKCGASVAALCLVSSAGAFAQSGNSPIVVAQAPVVVAQATTGNDGRLGNIDPITGRPVTGTIDLRGALDVTDAREFFIAPRIGIQESFTDNVLLSPNNQQTDFITRFQLDNTLGVNTGRTLISIQTSLSYDLYAKQDQLSDWSLQGVATGTYAAIPGFLYLDAEGEVTNGNITTFGSSAIDRASTAGRVQLATYSVGPRITTTVGDFADLEVRARAAQVHYDTQDSNITTVLPQNANILQASAIARTGERFANLEFVTAGNYQRDDHDFRLYNGIQSAFVTVMPGLRLLGRGGYEHIELPLMANLDAPIWSAGFEYTLNEASQITLEGGNRYNRPNYRAQAIVRLAQRLSWSASYNEILAPAQVEINSSFEDFMNLSRLLATPVVSVNSGLFGNLVNQPSLAKSADTQLHYLTDLGSLNFTVSWNDRRFVATGDHDRSLQGGIDYTHRLAADLSASIGGTYGRTFSSPIFGESEFVSGELTLAYQMNSTMEARAGYALLHSNQFTPITDSVMENVVFVSIQKSF